MRVLLAPSVCALSEPARDTSVSNVNAPRADGPHGLGSAEFVRTIGGFSLGAVGAGWLATCALDV